jgi:hypothetical protein
VKSYRLWLLLLLAVLIPFRGALAAGMLCPTGSGSHHVPAAHSLTHAEGHDHAQGHAPAGSATHDHAGADRCNLCTAFCSVPGLVSAGVTLASPQAVATVFPQPHAPPPSFISGGQERPPRST